jgi:rhodanese-related sulfurtransferase
MGFTNVSILEGGTNGWKQAGLETVPPTQNA